MAQNLEDKLTAWVAPVLSELNLSVYDIEVDSGRVRVVVDRPGGVGLDEIARCTRGLSPILDEHDPIGSRYTLEVTSPGLERKLRTVAHREGAVGETVKCKFRSSDGAVQRVEGVLREVTDDAMVIDTTDGPEHVNHDEVITARTVFVWPEKSSHRNDSRSRRPPNVRKATP